MKAAYCFPVADSIASDVFERISNALQCRGHPATTPAAAYQAAAYNLAFKERHPLTPTGSRSSTFVAVCRAALAQGAEMAQVLAPAEA
jgi:hypothetical protein